MTISVQCDVCSIRFRAESISVRTCGAACQALQARRQSAEDSNLPFTHNERFPITDAQRAIQRRAQRRGRK